MDRNLLHSLKKQIENPDYKNVGWVRGHLGLIIDLDQQYRTQMAATSTKDEWQNINQRWMAEIQNTILPTFETIDEVSSQQLERVLYIHGGWQSFLRKVDINILEHAFLITQHADHDREFQILALTEWNKTDFVDIPRL